MISNIGGPVMMGAGWGRKFEQTCLDDCLSLDAVVLGKRGFFNHTGSAKHLWRWTKPNGEVVRAELEVIMSEDLHGPRMFLTMPDMFEPGIKDQLIYLDSTQPNFGGRRWWLMCISGKRCRKLYLAPGRRYFMSRAELDLDYVSQHLGTVDRCLRQAQFLREQLDRGERSPANTDKPRGMWDRTYERSMRRIRKLENRADRALEESMRRGYRGLR